jgi:hypothetical protein
MILHHSRHIILKGQRTDKGDEGDVKKKSVVYLYET